MSTRLFQSLFFFFRVRETPFFLLSVYAGNSIVSPCCLSKISCVGLLQCKLSFNKYNLDCPLEVHYFESHLVWDPQSQTASSTQCRDSHQALQHTTKVCLLATRWQHLQLPRLLSSTCLRTLNRHSNFAIRKHNCDPPAGSWTLVEINFYQDQHLLEWPSLPVWETSPCCRLPQSWLLPHCPPQLGDRAGWSRYL